MEDLNKNQIVLLTLLVSFITSIATGIVTVTLMDQAPAGVTQTVNRVVERTIERVVPGEPVERVVIREMPVEITQEQLVMDVINEASPSVVRLIAGGLNLGSGFLIDEQGSILTSSRLVANAKTGDQYDASLRNGETLPVRVSKVLPEFGLALLSPEAAEWTGARSRLLASAGAAATTTAAGEWRPLELSAAEGALGQTVVALGFPEAGPLNVAVGIVSAIDRMATSSAPRLLTNTANVLNVGGPVLNIKGQVIGLSQEAGAALGAIAIQDFLAAATTPPDDNRRSNRR